MGRRTERCSPLGRAVGEIVYRCDRRPFFADLRRWTELDHRFSWPEGPYLAGDGEFEVFAAEDGTAGVHEFAEVFAAECGFGHAGALSFEEGCFELAKSPKSDTFRFAISMRLFTMSLHISLTD